MEKTPMRPYLKFIIIGGIFTGEGGGMLMSGFLFFYEAAIFASNPILASGAGLFTMLAVPFIIIGIVSLPIGLGFLISGAAKRSKWLADNPSV